LFAEFIKASGHDGIEVGEENDGRLDGSFSLADNIEDLIKSSSNL
jgi:hypothetical protein